MTKMLRRLSDAVMGELSRPAMWWSRWLSGVIWVIGGASAWMLWPPM
jgi:hypothetical protein